MNITKPFTFAANTFAKSSEVNADFDVAYAQININTAGIAQHDIDIENIGNNKANINGSSTQRFAVADPVSNGEAVNKGYMLSNSLPVGTILYYAGEEAPDGYLVCNGSEPLKSQFPALYDVIGETFGTSEDNTKFVLPDLIDKFIQGNTTIGEYIDPGLPNLKGFIDNLCVYSSTAVTGVFRQNNNTEWKKSGTDQTLHHKDVYFDASRDEAVAEAARGIYRDNCTTVQPPALTLLPIIKH